MNLNDVSKNTFWINIRIPDIGINSNLTAFSFEYKGEKYLVTAHHALEYEVESGQDKVKKVHELKPDEEITINVCGDFGFQTKKVRFIGSGFRYDDGLEFIDWLKNSPGRDVLVFQPLENSWLTPPILTKIDLNYKKIGAEIFFLGFPSLGGLEFRMLDNGGYPAPIARGGYFAGCTEECKVIFLDAHNCYGFSGGPVVLKDPYPSSDGFKVIGVISGFFTEEVERGSISNSGVTICSPISYVIELLDDYLEKYGN